MIAASNSSPRSDARILLVDGEPNLLTKCSQALEALGGVEVIPERDSRRAARRLRQDPFDFLITDLRLPGIDGLSLARIGRKRDPGLPVLVLTAQPSLDSAVQCLRLGAVDYLAKPVELEKLQANVSRALRLREPRSQRHPAFPQMICASPAMHGVLDTIDRVAGTEIDVLIQGETGTGKELVAHALRDRSRRRDKPFVAIDCGALPDTLLESELFGNERGAFTGASSRRTGLLEHAHKGTLFLDELGELAPKLQAKLLRSLQERKIRRLGGKQEIPVDVRVIAATARDLDQAIQEGLFRQDLLFRINVVTIRIPPLRERREDIPLLVDHFLARHGQDDVVHEFSARAMNLLQSYAWPGNIRELQNVVRCGIAMSREPVIEVEALPERLVAKHQGQAGGLFEARAEFERSYLTGLLRSHAGDARAAAEEARVPKGSFYRLLRKWSLRASDYKPQRAAS